MILENTVYTCLDYVYADILHTSIDLLLDEVGRGLMDSIDSLSVLCSQRRCGGHGIAAMYGDHFLVGFKPTVISALAYFSATAEFGQTDAPPELSEPAITSIRFIVDV